VHALRLKSRILLETIVCLDCNLNVIVVAATTAGGV